MDRKQRDRFELLQREVPRLLAEARELDARVGPAVEQTDAALRPVGEARQALLSALEENDSVFVKTESLQRPSGWAGVSFWFLLVPACGAWPQPWNLAAVVGALAVCALFPFGQRHWAKRRLAAQVAARRRRRVGEPLVSAPAPPPFSADIPATLDGLEQRHAALSVAIAERRSFFTAQEQRRANAGPERRRLEKELELAKLARPHVLERYDRAVADLEEERRRRSEQRGD